MEDSRVFAERQGPVLAGVIGVALIPPSVAAVRQRASPGLNGSCTRGSEAFAGVDDEGPTIIVEIKATSTVEDDHREQVACYGACG